MVDFMVYLLRVLILFWAGLISGEETQKRGAGGVRWARLGSWINIVGICIYIYIECYILFFLTVERMLLWQRFACFQDCPWWVRRYLSWKTNINMNKKMTKVAMFVLLKFYVKSWLFVVVGRSAQHVVVAFDRDVRGDTGSSETRMSLKHFFT